MKAEDWFKNFYNYYYENYDTGLKMKQKEAQAKNKDAHWTDAMNEFLDKLAEQMGYRVTHQTARIDHRWQREDSIVAIEHENNSETIDTEVDNLDAFRANLKVLITYFREDEYTWRPYRRMQEIKNKITPVNGSEFLLIYGSYGQHGDQYDWAALQIYPRIELRIDSVPTK